MRTRCCRREAERQQRIGNLDEVVVQVPGNRALQLAVNVVPRLPWACTQHRETLHAGKIANEKHRPFDRVADW